MSIQKFPGAKDGGDDLDYTLDWADVVVAGDPIVASVWTIPTGLTSHDESFTTSTTTVWLSGGTEGESYILTNVITTQADRIIERDVILKVKNL
jgi:hypothetical protein